MIDNSQHQGCTGQPPFLISLFSGAMGLDLGLERSGFQTAVAVESDPVAVRTARRNRPNLTILDKPIQEITTEEMLEKAGLKKGETTLLAGGPACQSFSTAGKRLSLGDPLGQLFNEFIRVVKEAQPEFFLMENVQGLLSAAVKHRPLNRRGEYHPPLEQDEELGSAFREIIKHLRTTGYYIIFDVLNAANYGTAQMRRRLIILGSRDGVELSMPSPTHSNEPMGLPSWRTLRNALESLHEDTPEYLEFSPSRQKYFKQVPMGGNWRDLPREMQSEALGGAFNSWGGRTGFFRRLSWDLPSPTLNTNPVAKATALCHPVYTRPLSVQEYARIQGFPDDWVILGTTLDKYRQLGNAVPVDMAQALGTAILHAKTRRCVSTRLRKVECWNLNLLNFLSNRPRTQLNPARMRIQQKSSNLQKPQNGTRDRRNDAVEFTPPHLRGAVGQTKLSEQIIKKLQKVYGSPDLGNYTDPIDELFFILLSQRTTGPSYERIFIQLKEWVSDWNELPNKQDIQVMNIISNAGLGRQKTKHILGIARRLLEDFGQVTLDSLYDKSNASIEAYLTSLPGIGVKSAKCVMLFSMGRQVLPVDAHVARVATRVGLVNPTKSKTRTHEVLEMVVRPSSRYDFHVNAIAHGRTTCRAHNPQCKRCPVRRICQYNKCLSTQ